MEQCVPSYCSISSLTKLGLPVLNMTLQGKAGVVYALHFALSDSPLQHRMWPNTLHTMYCKVLHNTLRQIRLLVVLTPGRVRGPNCCSKSGTDSLYGVRTHHYIYPSAALTLKFLLKYFFLCQTKLQYGRYWTCGTIVMMSHKGSLINRRDTSEDTHNINGHQHRCSQL